MSRPTIAILYEDNHLLAVNKPAGLATMGVSDDEPSLFTEAKAYLKQKYAKPGNVYLGVVSRLDAVTTGVTIFARTSKAAARLTDQFRERAVEKVYWAIVEGTLNPPSGECVHWVAKNESRRRMEVVSRGAPGAQEARLSYRTRAVVVGASLLEVRLETGRKHQIRVQLAHRGHPILGDEKYGAHTSFASGIALHARSLELTHPVRKTPLHLVAPVPRAWRKQGFASHLFDEP